MIDFVKDPLYVLGVLCLNLYLIKRLYDAETCGWSKTHPTSWDEAYSFSNISARVISN